MALNGHGNLKNNKVNPSIYFDKKDMGLMVAKKHLSMMVTKLNLIFQQ
jgi:hypothetical protein